MMNKKSGRNLQARGTIRHEGYKMYRKRCHGCYMHKTQKYFKYVTFLHFTFCKFYFIHFILASAFAL